MSDRFQELNVFVRVAEGGSFSRTARELGLAQSSVSRIVSDLEERIGVKLLLRTTRRVTPTDAGNAFLQRAYGVVEGLAEAEDAARGVDSLRGTLRVAMPATFGIGEVIPRLPVFLSAHPELHVELLTSDETHDLVENGAEVAIRFGRLASSSFGAQKLASVPRIAVASPAYLDRRGRPQTPADLVDHDCVFGPGLSDRRHWQFEGAEETLRTHLSGRVKVASAEGVISCAAAGLGVAVGSYWLCRQGLASGALEAVLTPYPLEQSELHAVYPAGRRPSKKVQAFIDYLRSALRESGIST